MMINRAPNPIPQPRAIAVVSDPEVRREIQYIKGALQAKMLFS